MAKSLAELRKNSAKTKGKKRRPRRTYSLCLAPDLLGEMHSLTNELRGLRETSTVPNEDGSRKTRRNATPEMARITTIRERIGTLRQEMADNTGVLVLETFEDDGDWDLWIRENPPRSGDAADPADVHLDLQVAKGYCNATTLMSREALEQFVVSFDDKPLEDGDWEYIYSNIGRGDKKELANLVVVMHEHSVDIPFLQRSLEAIQTSESG